MLCYVMGWNIRVGAGVDAPCTVLLDVMLCCAVLCCATDARTVVNMG